MLFQVKFELRLFELSRQKCMLQRSARAIFFVKTHRVNLRKIVKKPHSSPLCVVEDDVSDADEDGNDVGDGVEAEADHVEAVVEEIDAEYNRHQLPRRQMRPVVPNYRLSHQAGQFRFRNSRHVAKP